MGMDQYITAKHRVTGDTFPMMYWRKNYELNDLICELARLDKADYFVETELTQTLINDILMTRPKLGCHWFFEYLDGHLHRNGWYDHAHTYTPDYIYIYQADW